jgi:DNA topoisomerase I
MTPTVYDTTTIDFDLEGSDGRVFTFRATGSVMKFDGFTRLYRRPPRPATTGGSMTWIPCRRWRRATRPSSRRSSRSSTSPSRPPRFSEASLVKELEKLGIGRPSTYAEILSKIQDREYVEMEERRFVPTALGDTVSKLLVRVFPNLFDVAFTSRMEGELDRVEEGEVAGGTS